MEWRRCRGCGSARKGFGTCFIGGRRCVQLVADQPKGARISLEFDPDWDMSRANADVETALDGISTLPDDAEDP